ncbi:MAG: threonylcarbamoyl-AMP synthase [bacterium]|nr:threonylcarbamoyl-AMP synthase [bacterium]
MITIENIEKIKEILINDGVIAYVTDTVWGIGCLPSSEKAVRKIYEIKCREAKKPLILMSYDSYPLLDYIKQPVEKEAQRLMKQYFPGALTLVVEKSEKTPDYITSSMPTVGIRVPNNPVFAEICKHIDGHVLATTSANISGEPPALNYDEAVKYIGNKVNLVIKDYGYKAQGRASTVAGFKDGETVIFRQGDVII